eukprot:GHVH01000049.1.p1 GENE.GHVH01000049.1~~GHVH01000049.1.p1  ORF type:complete len:317 (+),score=48.95 GHVH01000049.1:56-1006(+)
MQRSIGIVGAGQIGNIAALLSITQKLGNVVLFDVVEGLPQGKALDLSHMATSMSIDCRVTATNDTKGLKDCDVLIVTAGVPRKPGMSRDDLLGINKKIARSVAAGVRENGNKPFCIITTNPLDVMVMEFQEESGLPTNMVVGMAGVLDASRFKFFLAERLGVSAVDIRAQLMGGHGDLMVPMIRCTTINGIPLTQFIGEGPHKITQTELDAICQRTRVGGGEIVNLMKTGSAFNAPAASCLEMARSFLFDEKRTLPCCCHLDGEYGQKNIYGGVPCVIGAGGVERVVELDLSEEETKQFNRSMDAVRDLRDACAKL